MIQIDGISFSRNENEHISYNSAFAKAKGFSYNVDYTETTKMNNRIQATTSLPEEFERRIVLLFSDLHDHFNSK